MTHLSIDIFRNITLYRGNVIIFVYRPEQKVIYILKIFRFLYGILERISYIFWVIAGFMIVFMAFITGYGVFMRYVMRSPNPYVYVINCILMLGCVILSLAQTQKLRRHLRVDLFDNYLPRGIFAILQNVIGPLLGLVFCIVLIGFQELGCYRWNISSTNIPFKNIHTHLFWVIGINPNRPNN